MNRPVSSLGLLLRYARASIKGQLGYPGSTALLAIGLSSIPLLVMAASGSKAEARRSLGSLGILQPTTRTAA